MTVDGDLLSAAALALTAIAVFYGLWGSQLYEAQQIIPERHRLDRTHQIESLQEVLSSKATPLMISTVTLGIVLAPPLFSTIIRSIVHIVATRGHGVFDYDAVQVLFVVVWLLIAGLAFLSLKTRRNVRRKLDECLKE